MNADNIRAELARCQRNLKEATDTGIQRVIKHRIADLERMLEELKEKDQ
jgi:hypothetical protein